jgi:hypothetical protein
MSRIRIGLLMNFAATRLKDGLRRFVVYRSLKDFVALRRPPHSLCEAYSPAKKLVTAAPPVH